jgi:hypothetical protein
VSFQGHGSLPADPGDMTATPHPRFPVQDPILSTIGDALSRKPILRLQLNHKNIVANPEVVFSQ